jgi:sigma-B regulation protein RsbU (phosphoserine phosphatase)
MNSPGTAAYPKDAFDQLLRDQLLERRQRLETGMRLVRDKTPLAQLLAQVDEALDRMKTGAYGSCEVCHDPIERERLLIDPLTRNCIDHLTQAERRALEEDLDLAWRIQHELLPERSVRWHGWDVSYHYEPAGPVSGDYCDLLTTESGVLFFLLGDVSGKGIAASMLMSHLHGMFRSLIAAGLPFAQLMERANRLFCESAMSGFFATLVLGKATRSGEVELCNAGHCPPLWLRGGEVSTLEADGVPLGMFCTSTYPGRKIQLEHGNSLILYTDGLTEARNRTSQEYGAPRLIDLLRADGASPQAKITTMLTDLKAFTDANRPHDDLSIMVVQRDPD